MGIAFLEAQERVRDQNAAARPLVCTCQMFGSGKTALGRTWQTAFFGSRFKTTYHPKLLNRHSSEALDSLKDSIYVHVKLQVHFTSPLSHAKDHIDAPTSPPPLFQKQL